MKAAASGIQTIVWALFLVVGGAITYAVYRASGGVLGIVSGFVTVFMTALVAASIRMANQWERAIVLRLGKFRGKFGPGLFFIVPIIDSVAYVIDQRTITTPFRAEKSLTLDTVPVNVDAVLFWRVVDFEKAALQVAEYGIAVDWASQTALRDVIGRSTLAQVLSDRKLIDEQMRSIIDSHTEQWGIRVESVEIRDVRIPIELESAMSRQAQAERERQARVILAQSEVQIAAKFSEAAGVYADSPDAMHLRAMNMLYEGLKEHGALMVVPSSALDSMNLGSLAGLAALRQQRMSEENATKAPLDSSQSH